MTSKTKLSRFLIVLGLFMIAQVTVESMCHLAYSGKVADRTSTRILNKSKVGESGGSDSEVGPSYERLNAAQFETIANSAIGLGGRGWVESVDALSYDDVVRWLSLSRSEQFERIERAVKWNRTTLSEDRLSSALRRADTLAQTRKSLLENKISEFAVQSISHDSRVHGIEDLQGEGHRARRAIVAAWKYEYVSGRVDKEGRVRAMITGSGSQFRVLVHDTVYIGKIIQRADRLANELCPTVFSCRL